jgi:succinate-semialdehyde dehydrogenase/glutarate-semialdehyde dehydrogenase
VSVNEAFIASWGSVAAPMGGRRASGLGRRHGREGLLRFTEPQTVAVQRGPGFGVLYAQGPERFTELFTHLLRAARATRLPWP